MERVVMAGKLRKAQETHRGPRPNWFDLNIITAYRPEYIRKDTNCIAAIAPLARRLVQDGCECEPEMLW